MRLRGSGGRDRVGAMGEEMSECPICKEHAEVNIDGLEVDVTCPRCGVFSFGEEGHISGPDRGSAVRLSGWIREQNAAGAHPLITREMQRRIMASATPKTRKRAELLLALFARKYPSIINRMFLDELVSDLELQAVSYSGDLPEVHTLLRVLADDGFMDVHPNNTIMLTAKGMLRAEDMGAKGAGAQGFVAMSFSAGMNEAWLNGFDVAIRKAGYSPFRIDSKDFIGGITDEIIAEIRRSRFAVADYTEQKNGVYFEAGFALGLGLTVIPTVLEDEINNLHFDIKHLNTLTWKDSADLALKLERRIRAVVW
jgi:hypothetical protein